MATSLNIAGRIAPRFLGALLLPRFSLEPRDYYNHDFSHGEQVVISKNVKGTPVGFAWLPAHRAVQGASRLYAFTPSLDDVCEAYEVTPAHSGHALVDAAYALRMDCRLPLLANRLDESASTVFILGVLTDDQQQPFCVLKMGVAGVNGDWLMSHPVATGHAQALGLPLLPVIYQGPFSELGVAQTVAPLAEELPDGVRIERRWGQVRHEAGYVHFNSTIAARMAA